MLIPKLLEFFGLRKPRPAPPQPPAAAAQDQPPARPIKVHCRCGKLLKAKAEDAGKECRCPGCGHLNRVPES